MYTDGFLQTVWVIILYVRLTWRFPKISVTVLPHVSDYLGESIAVSTVTYIFPEEQITKKYTLTEAIQRKKSIIVLIDRNPQCFFDCDPLYNSP